jgi:NADH dehydrogenase
VRVLVLGGGYGGVTLVRELERRLPDAHEILLVDDDGHHLLLHELHRVVRRPDLADGISVPIESLLDTASLRVAAVEDVDLDGRTVELASETLDYDACAVAIGAGPSIAVDGVAEHGIPLKTLADAQRIHERAVEVLSREDGRILVGGAGLSGVQVAGELSVLAEEAEGTAGSDAITLLEQADAVAPGFDAPFQSAIRAALEARGIEVRTGTTIQRATAEAVELEDGTAIDHELLVWTGGIAGRRALGDERPVVDATLRLGDRTFGLGDAVRAIDRDGEAVPATAQAAVRQAETVARNVERVLEGGGTFDPRLERFAFDSPGWVVSVGNGAVAKVGPTVVSGSSAVALKTSVGVGYLSSVGARREAVDLVNQELGLALGKD